MEIDVSVLGDDLFQDEERLEVPTAEDRYRYKKTGGSSDTKHTNDVFD